MMQKLRTPTFSMAYKVDLRLKEKVGVLDRDKFLSCRNALVNVLKNMAMENMNKVTMELGIKVGGKMGIPFVCGVAESNLKMMVECLFLEK
jgi:Trypsin-co-occurring domain 1